MLPDGNDRESNWTRNVRGFTGGPDATLVARTTMRPVNPIKTHYENVNDKTPRHGRSAGGFTSLPGEKRVCRCPAMRTRHNTDVKVGSPGSWNKIWKMHDTCDRLRNLHDKKKSKWRKNVHTGITSIIRSCKKKNAIPGGLHQFQPVRSTYACGICSAAAYETRQNLRPARDAAYENRFIYAFP